MKYSTEDECFISYIEKSRKIEIITVTKKDTHKINKQLHAKIILHLWDSTHTYSIIYLYITMVKSFVQLSTISIKLILK